MNTNNLKRFAQAARIKLIEQITAKLDQVLNTESVELIEKADELKSLRRAIAEEGRENVIDRVAYTWFNRLVALRFMDANDFQPLGIRVVSPADGETLPALLQTVRNGHIPDDLPVKREKINDLLMGRIPSNNSQEEVYRMLLVGACNHLHKIFPFLFEHIHDYTELLLPDDLLSQFSVLEDLRNGMSAEDCAEVEILGWLYQFYISELNAELIGSKKKYRKEDLAPASQLFTPKWIVQYMVDNTLGQVWAETNPDSKVMETLEFYIKPDYNDLLKPRERKSIEEIRFFEPCVGSGHILAYAFDVYYKIYEEEGYNPSEIPELIITKNLFGVDIDERAAQIASFVLLMKGRQKYRRFLSKVERSNIQPNISYYQDFDFDEKFKNAKSLGSLIQVEKEEVEKFKFEENSLFSERQNELYKLYQLLGQRYDVVVTNPPYISSNRMEDGLKKYVNKMYPTTKSDLFATFILRCLELVNDRGLTGYMTPFVWMFISSYEKLREEIIENHFINNLVQLEYSGFDGATVPICTFTLRNDDIEGGKGSYIRLSDFKGPETQAPKTLEAIQNPNSAWFYTKKHKVFKKIPGSNLGYWLSNKAIRNFDREKISNYATSSPGIRTGRDNIFIRSWQELKWGSIKTNSKSKEDLNEADWFPVTRGGKFRKWYGNTENMIYGKNEFSKIKTICRDYRLRNDQFYFKKGITWTMITSASTGFRICQPGTLYGNGGPTLFTKHFNYTIGLLNSNSVKYYLKVLNPTLNYTKTDIENLPLIIGINDHVTKLVESSINISKNEWSYQETSWEFHLNELIRLKNEGELRTMEETFQVFKTYWSKQFKQLHQNEEELNKEFIHIYGLEEELSPDVALSDITILKDELDKKKLAKLSEGYSSGWMLVDRGQWAEDRGQWAGVRGQESEGSEQKSVVSSQKLNDSKMEWRLEQQNPYPVLPFDKREIIRQFVSYAVGCMMGRYSLDKEGLILANQGETLEDYWRIVNGSQLMVDGEKLIVDDEDQKLKTKNQKPETMKPDDDAIIPVLDDEWFEDDIASQFKEFLRVSFGQESYQENLQFVEDALGRNIRDYFIRDFYTDHIRCYQKRPIYWQFSSPSGAFNVLVYMHRYNQDTLNLIYNDYLHEYKNKLENALERQKILKTEGTAREQTQALKEEARIAKVLVELQEYERELYKLIQSGGVSIDLDDGVLVNYNKFGSVIKLVRGLNDQKMKKRVRGFDWIDVEEIRD